MILFKNIQIYSFKIKSKINVERDNIEKNIFNLILKYVFINKTKIL